MITTIRNQFKQNTYKYAIFFIVFMLILSMISSSFIGISKESWAIRVNNVDIHYQDFAKEVAKQSEYIQHIKSQYGQYADLLFQSMGWSTDPKVRAIDILVKDELINQAAQKLGIVVSQEYIAASINDRTFVKNYLNHIIPDFLFDKSGALDMNSLKAFLNHYHISALQFEKQIEQALIHMQLMDMIATTSFVPMREVKQTYITKNLGKDFSYITFALDGFLAEEKRKSISNDELEQFYNVQNTQFRRYWVPEKRAALVWKFNPATYQIQISDQDIQDYYNKNKTKNYIADPLKVEIEYIALKKINSNGLSLSDIRNDVKNNPTSVWAKEWKKMAPFSRAEHKGALDKEAFLLQAEGDISQVFETNDGPMIIKLVRRIARTYQPMSKVHNSIKDILTEKAFNRNFIKDVKKVLDSPQESVDTFITEKSGKKEQIAAFAKDETRLSQELFTLKKGRYACYLEGNVGVIVKLTDSADRFLPDLASIKEVVTLDYYHNRAQKNMAQKMSEVKEAALNKNFEELHALYGGVLNYTGMIHPTDTKAAQELDKKGLPVEEMMMLEKIGSIIIRSNENKSIIVRLDQIADLDNDAFAAAQDVIQKEFDAQNKRFLLDSIVASLHRNATILTNDSIIILDEKYSE